MKRERDVRYESGAQAKASFHFAIKLPSGE